MGVSPTADDEECRSQDLPTVGESGEVGGLVRVRSLGARRTREMDLTGSTKYRGRRGANGGKSLSGRGGGVGLLFGQRGRSWVKTECTS